MQKIRIFPNGKTSFFLQKTIFSSKNLPVSAKISIFAADFESNLPIMEYISVIQFAGKYGISERSARNYCAAGKIDGAFLTGKTWNIPADADLPKKGKKKLSPLLTRLREEKESKQKGGIYHDREHLRR